MQRYRMQCTKAFGMCIYIFGVSGFLRLRAGTQSGGKQSLLVLHLSKYINKTLVQEVLAEE